MADWVDISEALLRVGLSGAVTNEERAVVHHAIRGACGAVRRFLGYDPAHGTKTEFLPLMDGSRRAGNLDWELSGNRAVLTEQNFTGRRELQLRHLPVRSITNIWQNESGRSGQGGAEPYGDDDLLVSGEDYWIGFDGVDAAGNSFSRAGLVHGLSSWPTVPGSIKATYVSGYTAAELRGEDPALDASPLLYATLEEIARRALRDFEVRKKAGSIGWTPGQVTSERLGDYSYTLGGTSGGGTAGDRRTGGVYDLLPESKEALRDFMNYGAFLGG